MAVHAQFERLETLHEEKRVEGAEGGSEIAEALDAGLHDIGEVAERLEKTDSVVSLAGFEQLGKAALVPGKPAAIDDDAADRGTMPADELGGRMDHDIGAVFDWPAQVGRCESVVDHQRKVVIVRDGGYGLDIEDV